MLRKALWPAFAAIVLMLGTLIGTAGTAQAATPLPCDIYASAGTPCVAAHSTVRALYASYSGRLYRVRRASDGTSADIGTLAAGGYADAAAQDSFCSGTVCAITEVYDQSPRGNNLTVEGAGGNGGADVGAIADALPATVGGHAVYGISVQAGVGYRNDSTSGIPTGSAAQGAYLVTGGQHVDNRCCFDYGNAETSNDDTGNGHMDAINFGTECWFAPCTGAGPWVQADLENGLFAGGNGSDPGNKGNASTFVTALLKNNGTTAYAIKDGNAQSGGLTTEYSGALPDTGGYAPMHQEGAIVLGTGGDDSNGSDGSFFEGAITAGYPTDAADNAVQAEIVSVGYTKAGAAVPVPGTAYRLTNANSGTLLDAVDCGSADGTPVDLWSSLGNTCQQWKFASAGNGHYTITNVNSGTVLDSENCGASNGTAVRLWTALGNTCQQWDVTRAGSRYTITNVGNGMVLDAADCGTADATAVRQWAQLDNACQQWAIAP
ncbi:arabinofuranosidase catalytic domain-containing protein [Streptantibioticus silvisoli]|uniref:Arabinofuranosidase catalytic domain-containing protein n=1 Tax=Streptantibioticus silvisoli TaxID=2705255 RepID=A0ABT6VSF6_9ACTN|nr:arabinofuranosidase catalytic domain-containing protein [Streptantibioticus silvisoli]MDI5961400.1 arabinofuranosidase catalytic domain-containing protein [Streptantibioticus silvisoli]